ncbi:MAG TPA: glycosyltransferase [Candidatus Sumerlaeota bacterium]|nr:glycosyltransferase [Candidatus Sumerlaeota bacterium]
MTEKTEQYDIICLSHLKWEQTLFQRPQQLMKLFSQQSKVIYVAHCSTKDFMSAVFSGNREFYAGQFGENLHYRTIPFLPFSRRSRFLQRLTDRITAFVARRLACRLGFQNVCLWLYYPSYVRHLDLFSHTRLVYDCMDHFRGFRASVGNIQDLENELMKKADIVFTGGRSLQRSKEGVNPKTICFPSGVEYEHFLRAAGAETPVPGDICDIPGPILGYFGAVDERLDFTLLDRVCEVRPDWSVVLIGPLVGMNRCPVDRPNFHHLGPRKYADLPGYLKAFDVCMMPFVISELTLHISPTKTPEYLAGGKPVISTPIPDVVADYSDVVSIAGNAEEFIEKTRLLLESPPPDLHVRIRRKAETKSWQYIADRMREHVIALDVKSSKKR